MSTPDLSTTIIHTKQQIDHLKQQIETSKEKRRLQHQLKEIQILRLWQLSQAESRGC